MIEFSEIFLRLRKTGKDMQLAGNSGLLILGTVHFLKFSLNRKLLFIKLLFSKYSFLEKFDHFIYHVRLNSTVKPSFKIILAAILLNVKSSYV